MNTNNNTIRLLKKSDFILCSNEKKILREVRKKLSNYGSSSKNKYKKEVELFHLLCFLSLSNRADLWDKITPNEPGDFIIKENEKVKLIEVTTCLGNDDSNEIFQKQLNLVFGVAGKKYRSDKKRPIYGYSIKEATDLFLSKHEDKINLDYVKNRKFDSVELLVVTTEYECCFPNWMSRFISEEFLANSPFDKIMVLDYFSSGKDGNPTIIEDLEARIKVEK